MALKAVAAPLGSPVGGSGTSSPSTIPRWTGASTLGDSLLSQSGSIITNSGTFRAANGSAAECGYAFATLPNTGMFLNPSDPYLKFSVGGTPRVLVASTGEFLVPGGSGLTTVQELGQIAGNLKIGLSAANSFLTFGDENNTQRYNGIYRPASSNTMAIGSYNLITFNVSAAALGSQTERARIDSSGNLILNTANTGATIQAAGSQQGLKLPATPDNTNPNTLDCYADGGTANSGGVAWTPSLRFGGATTGITGSQVGRYTRIGNMVFAQGTLALSSKGSATGSATISGLPTSANVAATIYYSISIGYNSKVTFTGQLHGLISVNSGIVELYQTSTAGVVSAIANTDFANDSVLTFTVAYPVT